MSIFAKEGLFAKERGKTYSLSDFVLNREDIQYLIGPSYVSRPNNESLNLGRVLIISGPSGVGKDTIINELLRRNADAIKVTSATTRDPRVGEVNSYDYHFINTDLFDELQSNKLMIDSVTFSNNKYGIPYSELGKRLSYRMVIINAVPESAKIMKSLIPDSLSILIMPPSEKEQRRRLRKRGKDTPKEIDRRIEEDKNIFSNYEELCDVAIISENGRNGVVNAVQRIEDLFKQEEYN